MLQSRGTCNTISAFDQAVADISPEERIRGAELLARHLYGELFQSVCRDIERHGEPPFTGKALRDAIAGRDWLFDEGNYHIDVSHLGSVVRFARFLSPESSELDTVLQLTEYGGRLSPQFQFPGDPPFDAYYTAHLHFFRILANDHRDEAIAYFQDRIRSAEEFEDRRLIAYVLVDLLVRIGAKNGRSRSGQRVSRRSRRIERLLVRSIVRRGRADGRLSRNGPGKGRPGRFHRRLTSRTDYRPELKSTSLLGAGKGEG